MSLYLKMVERWDVSRIAFESIDTDQQSYAEVASTSAEYSCLVTETGAEVWGCTVCTVAKVSPITAVVAGKFAIGCTSPSSE